MGASYLIPPVLLRQKCHEENPLLHSCKHTKKAKLDFWYCYVIFKHVCPRENYSTFLVYSQTTCLKVKSSKNSKHDSLQFLEGVKYIL